VASAAAAPAASSVTCVKEAHSDDNWVSGYCLHGGAAIAYQEHVKCSNGKTFDGNVVTSTNGSPESKATCLGANNFVFSESITHTRPRCGAARRRPYGRRLAVLADLLAGRRGIYPGPRRIGTCAGR
jgi:hypothetical protein